MAIYYLFISVLCHVVLFFYIFLVSGQIFKYMYGLIFIAEDKCFPAPLNQTHLVTLEGFLRRQPVKSKTSTSHIKNIIPRDFILSFIVLSRSYLSLQPACHITLVIHQKYQYICFGRMSFCLTLSFVAPVTFERKIFSSYDWLLPNPLGAPRARYVSRSKNNLRGATCTCTGWTLLALDNLLIVLKKDNTNGNECSMHIFKQDRYTLYSDNSLHVLQLAQF